VPRSLWSGTISFGLVSVPVRMVSAVQSRDLHFNYVHAPDGSRIGYEKVCKQEGRPVPDDEIVKAFEYEPGEWVYMEDEDFRAAGADRSRTIEIRDFVELAAIDPVYFEQTYYLAPQDGGEKVYALLRRAMEDAGLAAIAKFVMRDRQHLGCLRVREGAIVLERMHFADEIRPPDDVGDGGVEVDGRELEMAARLVEQFRGEWDPEQYRDTYRDALCDIIRARRRGEPVHAEPAPREEEPTDLIAALRASIEAAQGRRGGGRRRGRANGGGGNGLESLTKDELLDRARERDLPGRSRMSKDELVEALGGA
jgi:DNA end-binding protein Ku